MKSFGLFIFLPNSSHTRPNGFIRAGSRSSDKGRRGQEDRRGFKLFTIRVIPFLINSSLKMINKPGFFPDPGFNHKSFIAGNTILNVLPFSSSLSTVILPPLSSTISLTIDMPRPIPVSLVV